LRGKAAAKRSDEGYAADASKMTAETAEIRRDIESVR